MYALANLMGVAGFGFETASALKIAAASASGNAKRVHSIVVQGNVLVAVLVAISGAIVFLLRRPIVAAYAEDDEEVQRVALSLLPAGLALVGFEALAQMLGGCMRGLMLPWTAVLVFGVGYYVVGLGSTAVLCLYFGFGLHTLWWCFVAACATIALTLNIVLLGRGGDAAEAEGKAGPPPELAEQQPAQRMTQLAAARVISTSGTSGGTGDLIDSFFSFSTAGSQFIMLPSPLGRARCSGGRGARQVALAHLSHTPFTFGDESQDEDSDIDSTNSDANRGSAPATPAPN